MDSKALKLGLNLNLVSISQDVLTSITSFLRNTKPMAKRSQRVPFTVAQPYLRTIPWHIHAFAIET